MGQFLTKKQRLDLIQAHRKESNLRYGDRIKALLLDPSRIRGYQERYESDR